MKGDYHENKKWNLSRGRCPTAPVHYNLPFAAIWTDLTALFQKQRVYQISDHKSGKTKNDIIYDKENGLLCDSQESANNPDYGMIASFWVLLDFKTAIMYHTDGEFPVKLNFFSKDEWYEVLYVPQEQEYLINHVMESQTKKRC